jgi:hypothetical protein
MTADGPSGVSRARGPRRIARLDALTIAVVAVIALGLRSYRLSSNPLWLDEIYGYQLGQLGIRAIFSNSLADPHPPLFYLLQWVASGFGLIRTEWAWRWLVVAAGTTTVLLTYWLARMQRVSPAAALLSCVVFALCPTHIYFSQEARSPAIALCICTITTLLMWRVRADPLQHRRWLAYAAVSLLGVYIDYEYILVIGAQLCYLFFVLRLRRMTFLYSGALALGMLPIALLGSRSVMGSAKISASESLSAVQIVQSLLGGDFIRYGLHWTHAWLALAIGALMIVGLWSAYRSGILLTTSYYLLQIALPLMLYFGFLSPVLHIRLPLSEAKNFIVLLPSMFILAAQGTHYIGRRLWGGQADTSTAAPLGRSAATLLPRLAVGAGVAALYASLIYASGLNLQRYWNTTKSPEGQVVLDVRRHIQPNDAIVSLHYSLDAALSFYMPDVPHYTRPQASSGGYAFSQSTSILHIQPPAQASIPLGTITSEHPRIWLLALAPGTSKLVKTLGQICTVDSQQPFGPFIVSLLERCERAPGAAQ